MTRRACPDAYVGLTAGACRSAASNVANDEPRQDEQYECRTGGEGDQDVDGIYHRESIAFRIEPVESCESRR
jgi:hypothetical protein